MSDPQFARLNADSRFRCPKKPRSEIVVEERFKRIFGEDKAGKKLKQQAKRKEKQGALQALSSAASHLVLWLQAEWINLVVKFLDKLRRYYRPEYEEDEEAEAPTSTIPDYARRGTLMESSESKVES
jgi:hypothetical protein